MRMTRVPVLWLELIARHFSASEKKIYNKIINHRFTHFPQFTGLDVFVSVWMCKGSVGHCVIMRCQSSHTFRQVDKIKCTKII